MASEITYAEVKFKNESPTPVVKGLPEKKKPEQHPQKYPLWLPWLISLLLLLVCIALVVVLLVVVPFSHSSDQPSALQQQFSKWECDSAVPQGTGQYSQCPLFPGVNGLKEAVAGQVKPHPQENFGETGDPLTRISTALGTQSSLAIPQCNGKTCLNYPCLFKDFLSGKLTEEDMSTVPGKPGSLQSPSLVSSLHLSASPCTERGWTCCPKGWRRFQRSCYFLSLDRMNCAESAQNCTGMGSQLVVITSKAEQEFLSMQISQPVGRDNFYIGLFEVKVGQWQWMAMTPYNGTPTFWRQGEPSDNLDGNCTVMDVVGVTLYIWNNVKPYTMHHRICEAAAVIV